MRAEGEGQCPACEAPLRPCCLTCPAFYAWHAEGCAGLPPRAVCTCGCLIVGGHMEPPYIGCRTLLPAGPLVCPCPFPRLAPIQPERF